MNDLIVDANSIYARAFYAAKGQPRDTLIASLNIAIMLLSPNRVGEKIYRTLFCWDGGQKKDKQRALRPPEYEDTKADVKDCLEAMLGAPQVRLEGFEADDLIATAATHSTANHVIVASADKDLHQLNSEKISIFDVNNKGFVSRREILAKWHVKRPVHVAIALAIQGDSADKIYGIKGWGPKKVEKLFEAVTPEMAFDEVFETIRRQIPEDRQPEFLDSLNLTLLNCDISGVPEPSPLMLCEPDYLEMMLCEPDYLETQGFNEVMSFYKSVFFTYYPDRKPRSQEYANV